MKQLFLMGFSLFVACLQVVLADPVISDLKVTPIPPWGLAIDYTVSGATSGDTDAFLVVQATGGGRTYAAKNLSGDTKLENGAHRVYWNMAKDGITADVQNGSVTVFDPLTYCIIDLSSGADSEAYPIAYLGKEPEGGFNTEEYKTTKLVLKRLDVGAFIMGYDQTDESHRVTLTKPFYMGLFEVTQKQWELVMGSKPANFKGDARPVENVSYNMIRGSSAGAQWPASNAVDADSFLGRLRARTGIAFDLPTAAQWEYACRAGTTKVYSYGDSADGAYMWYNGNSDSQTHEVGAKLPNPWGFYDLHGNVWEWCLDWYGDLLFGVDPNGSSSGSSRVERGGSCYNYASICTSSYRYNSSPSSAYSSCGLRLVRILFD